jgi:histidinol-phosphate aminotransferase
VPLVPPYIASLRPYEAGLSAEEVERAYGVARGVKLASNENPLGPSPAALAAMQKVLTNLNLYPDGNAFYLKKRLAEKLGIAPANIVLGNGSSELIEFVGHALLKPGFDALMSQYAFLLYYSSAKLFDANPVIVPAKNYGHDLPAMLAAITPKTRVVFVANPNNPTGTLVSNEELLKFVNAVPGHILVVVDEAYIEFLEQPPDLVSLIREGRKANLLIMRTFSKIFGLAGLRIGYGIGPAEITSALEIVRPPFNINSIAQAGALAALDDTSHIRRTRVNNVEGLRYFEAGLARIGVEFIPSVGNFILARVGDGKKVFEEMQKLGVIVRPMGGYELPDWVRITVGTPAQNERCLNGLKKVL